MKILRIFMLFPGTRLRYNIQRHAFLVKAISHRQEWLSAGIAISHQPSAKTQALQETSFLC